jgi:hypothetical protein
MVFGHRIRGGYLSAKEQRRAFVRGLVVGAIVLGAALLIVWAKAG